MGLQDEGSMMRDDVIDGMKSFLLDPPATEYEKGFLGALLYLSRDFVAKYISPNDFLILQKQAYSK